MIDLWIVLDIRQTYGDGYIEGVEHLASFATEQEANDYVLFLKERKRASWAVRLKYIEEFVDSIVIPETDYNGWKEFLKSYGIEHLNLRPDNFREGMKRYLNDYSPELNGFNPPKSIRDYDNLFVLKI